MSIHTKIITEESFDTFDGHSLSKTLMEDTLLDRDLVLSLQMGDILFHEGFKLSICGRIFTTPGAGGGLTATLIVLNQTE